MKISLIYEMQRPTLDDHKVVDETIIFEGFPSGWQEEGLKAVFPTVILMNLVIMQWKI